MTDIRTSELADEAGVHIQRVYQWAREGLDGAAKLRRGYYDREKALAWIEARRLVNEHDPPNVSNPAAVTLSTDDVVFERYRVLRSQADGNELRNDRLRGDSLSAGVVMALEAAREGRDNAVIDEWVRDGKNAADIADRLRLANALKEGRRAAREDLRDLIANGEDLSATRIRESRRVG